MDNDKNIEIQNIEQIFSLINILKIISNTADFRQWLKKYHKIQNDEKFYTGYQFFCDSVFCKFFDSLTITDSFEFEFDYTLFRAQFFGVNIDDIPLSGKHVKLLKNIWNYYRIRKCNNWEKLSAELKEKNTIVFSIFDQIFKNNIKSTSNISKENVLLEKSLYWTLLYLDDTEKQHPNGYPGPLLKSFINENNYDKVFLGYQYALQYLWFKLLKPENFLNSPAYQLHRALEFIDEEKKEKYGILDIRPNFSNLTEENVYYSWQSLDRFFGEMNDALEERKTLSKGLIGLKISKKILFSDISPLLNLIKISEPNYMIHHKNLKDLIKYLDQFFFWHEMDVLDTNKIHIFNGASAFISVVIGEVEKYRIIKNTDPIWVARIKHPVGIDHQGKEGNDISYAILLQNYGIFTDYSGWLIFLNCGTDYSGSGGGLYLQIEEFLTKYMNERAIEIKELSILSDQFIRYLRQKEIPSLVQKIKRTTNELLDQSIFKDLSSSIYEGLQELEENDIQKISSQIDKITTYLHFFIPDTPKNHSIIQKIDKISEIEELPQKLDIIVEIIPLIPYVVLNDKLEVITSKIDNLDVRLSPGPSASIVISTGLEIAGTGVKYELTIPVEDISYEDIYKDLDRLKKGQFSIKQLPKLKAQVLDYIQNKWQSIKINSRNS
jgi:hypothetical protein